MGRNDATALLHERASEKATGWSGLFDCTALNATEEFGPRCLPLDEALEWARYVAVRVLVFVGGQPLKPYNAGDVLAEPPYPCETAPPIPEDLSVGPRPFGPADSFVRYKDDV